jgi:hypothetical protein
VFTQPVTDPNGMRWKVRRRWTPRWVPRPQWRGGFLGDMSGGFDWIPDFGLDGGFIAFLLFGGIIFVLVAIPLLLFGIELLVACCVIAAGLIGRLLLGRPWRVEARSMAGGGFERVIELEASGWRGSRRLIETLKSDLVAGREPGWPEPDGTELVWGGHLLDDQAGRPQDRDAARAAPSVPPPRPRISGATDNLCRGGRAKTEDGEDAGVRA